MFALRMLDRTLLICISLFTQIRYVIVSIVDPVRNTKTSLKIQRSNHCTINQAVIYPFLTGMAYYDVGAIEGLSGVPGCAMVPPKDPEGAISHAACGYNGCFLTYLEPSPNNFNKEPVVVLATQPGRLRPHSSFTAHPGSFIHT